MLPGAELPANDEELTGGTSRTPWPALGLLVVALVAALLGARLLQGHHATGPATASGSPTATHRDLAALVVDTPLDCPPAGNGQTVCSTSPHVPADVLAAVRARFPQAQQVDAVEERLRDARLGVGGLWYRALSAISGEWSIVVVIRHRTADDAPFEHTSNGGLADRIQVARLAGKLTVVAAVSAPHGKLPSPTVVRALANDPRLLTAAGT